MLDNHDEDFEEIERELQRRLKEAGLDKDEGPSENRFPEPPSDEEIDSRLNSMRDKVSSAGRSGMPEPPDFQFKRPKAFRPQEGDRYGYKGLGIGMTAAYALVGMMALGFGIGWLLDHGHNTSNFGPAIGGLVGCVVGIGFVIWLINRPNQ